MTAPMRGQGGGERGATGVARRRARPARPRAALSSAALAAVSSAAPPPGRREPDAAARETRLARLTHAQYLRTVQDLLGLRDTLDLAFAPDALNGFGFDTSADLRVDARLGPQYRAMAERLADRAVTDDAVYRRVVPCDPASPGCADEYLAAFGERAFRRPLAEDELASFRALHDLGAELVQGPDPFRDGVRLALEAFLQSPQFLYRTEASVQAGAGGRIPLSDWEVAARLSYFLYDSMPDDELFAAARAGELRTPEQVEAQARRMLEQPRVLRKLVRFTSRPGSSGASRASARTLPPTPTCPRTSSGACARRRSRSSRT